MSISKDDFVKACRGLHAAFRDVNADTTWEDVKILEDYGTRYLRITRKPRQSIGAERDSLHNDDEDGEMTETDGEALRLPAERTEDVLVVYDILHSPTYGVPVLYLTLQRPSGFRTAQPPAEELYDLLIPHSYRAQVENVGIAGALSMTDHPITSLPTYFIHPCRTGEAMSEILAGREEEVKAEEWFLMWLGLVGGGVGLAVPVQLIEGMAGPRQGSSET